MFRFCVPVPSSRATHSTKLTVSLSLLTAATLVPCTSVQVKYHVSPVVAAKNFGSSQNSGPFSNPTARRYQQIHSDMPRQTMSIKALGWRHNSPRPGIGSRTLDAELWMGSTVAWNACSFFFDKNWVQSSKTLVVKRRTIVLTTATTPSPGFDTSMEIKLDAPYIYRPISDSLGWEVHVYSNRKSGGFDHFLDADSCASAAAPDTAYGTGCVAGGQVNRMLHSVEGADRQGTLFLILSARYCPANAPSILVLGTTQLSIAKTGLCANLYTNPIFVLPFGASDANGDLHRSATYYMIGNAGGIILAPNPGAGTLYSQVFSLDTTQSGIPLAASNGISLAIPASGIAGKKVEVTRLVNDRIDKSTTMARAWPHASVGYGLPTRFTY